MKNRFIYLAVFTTLQFMLASCKFTSKKEIESENEKRLGAVVDSINNIHNIDRNLRTEKKKEAKEERQKEEEKSNKSKAQTLIEKINKEFAACGEQFGANSKVDSVGCYLYSPRENYAIEDNKEIDRLHSRINENVLFVKFEDIRDLALSGSATYLHDAKFFVLEFSVRQKGVGVNTIHMRCFNINIPYKELYRDLITLVNILAPIYSDDKDDQRKWKYHRPITESIRLDGSFNK
jgi:hypothetical protein